MLVEHFPQRASRATISAPTALMIFQSQAPKNPA